MAISTSDLPSFTRGQLGFGSGDLQQAVTARISYTNNSRLKHSLRKSPSGVVKGNVEASGSFDAEVPSDGSERKYFERVKSGEEVEFRYKVPQQNLQITGVLVSVDAELPLDDAVKFTVNWVGKVAL